MALMTLAQGPGDTKKFLWAQKHTPTNSSLESNYLLSRDTVPRVYIIELDPDFLGDNFTFKGNSTIYFEVLKPTVNVTIHKSNRLDIDEIFTELIYDNGTTQKPIKQTWTLSNEFYTLQFNDKLAIGNYTLKLKWTGGNVNGDSWTLLSGFYRAEDKDNNGNSK